MPEQPQWRVEKYEDPMDPFATIQWYVMQGNVVIAQCEIEAYARRIVADHERYFAYEQALELSQKWPTFRQLSGRPCAPSKQEIERRGQKPNTKRDLNEPEIGQIQGRSKSGL